MCSSEPPPGTGRRTADPPVDQKLTQLGGWLEVWKALTLIHQEEQEATLNGVVLGASRVIVQLENLLKLTNVTSRQNVLLQEDIDVVKGLLAIAALQLSGHGHQHSVHCT